MEHIDDSTPRYGVETGGPTYFTGEPSPLGFRFMPSPAVCRSDPPCPTCDGTARRIGAKSVAYGIWDGAHIRLEDGRLVAYEPDADGILVRTPEQPVRVQVKRRQGADGASRLAVGYRYRGKIRWVRAWEGDRVIRKRPLADPSKPSLAAHVARLVSDHLASGDGDSEPPAPSRDRQR